MNVTCSDRDGIFEDGKPTEWAALEAHAATCPQCAEEVRAWKSLSIAAEALVLLPAKLFACVANGSGWCFRSGANDFQQLDLLSPSGSHRGQRQFALAEQCPERSGKRGNGV